MNTTSRALSLGILLLWASGSGGAAQKPGPVTNGARLGAVPLDIKSGQTLSREVLIKVGLTNPLDEYGSVRLSVDGAYVGMGGDRYGASAATPFTAVPLATDGYSNGWHLLTVQEQGRRAAQYRVKFHNDVSNISVDNLVDPGSPGRKNDPPRNAHVTAVLSRAQPWSVRIESTTDHPSAVRVYRGTGRKIDIHWDCKDNVGRVVPDDSYTVLLQAGKALPHIDTINKDTLRG